MNSENTKPETAVATPIQVSLGTLRAADASELLSRAEAIATTLARVVQTRGLALDINGKAYVRCEGWTTLAAMLGVTPHEVEVVERPEGVFTATVELRRLGDGMPVARASAECGAPDETWGSRPRYARRSMALTRATAKACRLAFSWIMVLAGYEPTPAEEVEPSTESGKIVVVPGSQEKWGGWGGKPITEVPGDVLTKIRDWLAKRDAARNQELIAAIERELASRAEQKGEQK